MRVYLAQLRTLTRRFAAPSPKGEGPRENRFLFWHKGRNPHPALVPVDLLKKSLDRSGHRPPYSEGVTAPLFSTACLCANRMPARSNSSLTCMRHSRSTSAFLNGGVFTMERIVTPISSIFSTPR